MAISMYEYNKYQEQRNTEVAKNKRFYDIAKAEKSGLEDLYFGAAIVNGCIFTERDVFEDDYSDPYLWEKPEIKSIDKYTQDNLEYYVLKFKDFKGYLTLTKDELDAGLVEEKEKEIEEIER